MHPWTPAVSPDPCTLSPISIWSNRPFPTPTTSPEPVQRFLVMLTLHQQLDQKYEVLGKFWTSEKKVWHQICWSEPSEKFWFQKNFRNSELFRSSEFKSEFFRRSDLWSDYFQIFRFFVKLLMCQDWFSTDLSLGIWGSGFGLALRPECCIAGIALSKGWEGRPSA